MRQIKYIFIDSDREGHGSKSGRGALPLLGYHFTVNSEGLVINGVDIHRQVNLIPGPIYDPDKYNRCSVFIRYCGSIRTEAWLLEPATAGPDALKPASRMLQQREALKGLLVELRQHFPEAKILGVSEINGKEYNAKNIIVSDAMNAIRREMSDLP